MPNNRSAQPDLPQRKSGFLPTLLLMITTACAIHLSAAEQTPSQSENSAASTSVLLQGLVVDMPHTWRITPREQLAPGLNAAWTGPDDQRLIIMQQTEPIGIEAGITAWFEQQVNALRHTLPEISTIEQSTVSIARYDWQRLSYRFRHGNQWLQQTTWMTVRIANGVHQAWIITHSIAGKTTAATELPMRISFQ